MKREDIIHQIVEVTFNYHMRYAMDMVPDELYKWIKFLLRKLDNVELAREARKCGIKIKAKDIFVEKLNFIMPKDLKNIRFLPEKNLKNKK